MYSFLNNGWCCKATGQRAWMYDFKIRRAWGTWVAHSVEHPTSAQVMIPWFMSSSPMSGSVLTVWSLLGVLSLSLSLSLSPLPPLALCISK